MLFCSSAIKIPIVMFKSPCIICLFLLFGLVACEINDAKRQFTAPSVSTSVFELDNLAETKNNNTPTDDDTVNIKMTAHATQLVFRAEDFNRQDLADSHVRELKSWWDSLPKPLQAKVKQNAISVEVVSNIRSNTQSPNTSAQKSDAQIEQTGAALERVIGSTTDMTYTVNTTVVEKISSNQPATPKSTQADELATTNISLVETVPVKLSQFNIELPLQDLNELNTETAQALQYWWNSLPEDLQTKIKQQEINIQLGVHSIDRNEIGKNNAKPILGLNADAKIVVLEDLLVRIIGTYRAGTRAVSFAKISTTANIEKSSRDNAHIRTNQYLRIQLRNNRSHVAAPSAM
jgi:hypothetical protein